MLKNILCLLLLLAVSITLYADPNYRNTIEDYLASIHAQRLYKNEIQNGITTMLQKHPLLKPHVKHIEISIKRSLPWSMMRSLLISSLAKDYSAEDFKLAIGTSPSLNANDAKLVDQLINITTMTIRRTVDFNIKNTIRKTKK